MNPAPQILMVSCCALIGSSAWLTLGEQPPMRLPEPRWAGEPVRGLDVDVPRINPFSHYYLNDLNPFVPFNERVAEESRRQGGIRSTNASAVPTAVPPQSTVELILPSMQWPSLDASGQSVPPTVLGRIRVGDHDVVSVELGGKKAILNLGDRIGTWKLSAISGREAIFIDSAGDAYPVLIGTGDANRFTALPRAQSGSEQQQAPSSDGLAAGEEALRMLNDPAFQMMLRIASRDPVRKAQLLADPRVKAALSDPRVTQRLRELGIEP